MVSLLSIYPFIYWASFDKRFFDFPVISQGIYRVSHPVRGAAAPRSRRVGASRQRSGDFVAASRPAPFRSTVDDIFNTASVTMIARNDPVSPCKNRKLLS